MNIEIVEDLISGYWTHLSIDDEIDDTSNFNSGILTLYKEETINKLSTLKVSEFRNCKSSAGKLNLIVFPYDQKITEWSIEIYLELSVSIYKGTSYNTNEPYYEDSEIYPAKLILELNANPRVWNKEYTMDNIASLYESTSQKYADVKYQPSRSEKWGAEGLGGIAFDVKDESQNLQALIQQSLEIYEKISLEVLSLLPIGTLPDVLTTLFQFPEELKIACKQYLIYFAQFLSDIGIDADTSIKEEANKVLFTVRPKDGSEALSRIKEALEVYMNIPGISLGDEIIANETKDVAVLQLEANVHHLKSQIMLQQAVLQTKDATIEFLKLSNYILTGETTSTKHLEGKATDLNEEKLLGGIVKIKEYEGKGFSIDLPSIIRKLKRKK